MGGAAKSRRDAEINPADIVVTHDANRERSPHQGQDTNTIGPSFIHSVLDHKLGVFRPIPGVRRP